MIYQELRKIPTDIGGPIVRRKRRLQKSKDLPRIFPIDVCLLKESDLITAIKLFNEL